MNRKSCIRLFWCCLAATLTIVGTVEAQVENPKAFEKRVAGNDPIFVNGERIYRPKEVSQAAVVTLKPEPLFTDKARKKRTHGTVLLRAVFTSSGNVIVLNVLKRLPNGLTEQALGGASKIRFTPALLDGKPVSQIILLQYNFNRY